jgi:hypothetical protein
MEEPLILLCFSIVLMHVFSIWFIKDTISNLANELKHVVLEREETLRESYKDSYDPLNDESVHRMQ